jgi:hypothetical protein
MQSANLLLQILHTGSVERRSASDFEEDRRMYRYGRLRGSIHANEFQPPAIKAG